MARFRYEPFHPQRPPSELILVGAPAPAALHLSHWPGHATPPELRAETCLESALKFLGLKAARREALGRGAGIATTCAPGVDALLALWALTAPQRAQGFTGPLQAAAYTGEYDVPVYPEATKICCALRRLADPDRSPARDEPGGGDPWARLGQTIGSLLPRLDEVFGSVDRFAPEWREEYELLQADRALVAEGKATLEEVPQVDLAVVRAPRLLHPAARNGATDRLRVLTLTGEGVAVFTYRAESWADLPARRVPPRIDLGPLLPELQGMESAGTWRWDGLAARTPSLWCADAQGRPGPTGIAPDRLLALLRDFLARHAGDTAIHWNPRAPAPSPVAGSRFPVRG